MADIGPQPLTSVFTSWPSSVSPKILLNLLQEHPTAIIIIFVLQEKGLCINTDLINKGTTQVSDILMGAQGASWKASTLFGGRRPLLKAFSSMRGERTTWGWPQGSCQGSGNSRLGADGKRTAKAFSGSPPGVVQCRPSHPFQLSLRPLLRLPPYRNRLFQANGLLEHAGRGPPLRVQASFLSEKHHRVRAQADETRAFACKPRSHLSSPGPDGALPCLFRVFLRHHQVYLSACPEAPSVPAHRETLSSHALAGCAILGKLTSLGLGFFS